MKKGTFIISMFVIICFVSFQSCSGKKDLEQGNYTEAVYKSINKLRSNPDHKKATSTLKQAYPLALSYCKDQIQIALASNDQYKWNKVVDNMTTVNSMADDITRCPAARKVVPTPSRYDNDLTTAKNNAAEECYAMGQQELEKSNRLAAREAYFLFVKANNLVNGYKDVTALIPQAKSLATLKVVLEQIPVGAPRLEVSAQFFQNNVQTYINNMFNSKQFLQLYLPREAEQMQLVPDQIIHIQFDDFSVGDTRLSQKTNTVTSRDSVKVGDYKKPDGTRVPVKNTVKADITVFRKEVLSRGMVDIRIIEYSSNKILLEDKLPGEYVWSCQWASFNGDERALSSQDASLCRQHEERPPSPQDLFVEFTKPIYNQITEKLNTFYSRY